VVPGAGSAGRQRASVFHAIDWAARPGEAGAGATLMKAIGSQAGALIAIGGSADTLAILPHLGFRAAGAATLYVRTLRPLRLFDGAGRAPWRALPRFVRGVAGVVAACAPAAPEWRGRRISAEGRGQRGGAPPGSGSGTPAPERRAS